MFSLEERIERWRREMTAAGITDTAALDELEAHLREDVERAVCSGLDQELAFEQSVKRLGDQQALSTEFQKAAAADRRRLIKRGVLFGIGVFVVALGVCYFVILPLAMNAEAAYMHWLGFSYIQLQSQAYMRFALRLVIGMSLAFEIPVVVLVLARLGVVDQRLLSKARKYVLVLNLLLSALVTGPGVVPQLLLFLVFQGMYELGVWVARAVDSQRFTL